MKIEKELGQLEATKLADYILKNYGPMSHLKLQKLLYYCEGYHLAYFGEPVVYDNFQAWVHGPVCREVYDSLEGASVLYSDVSFDGDSNTDSEVINMLTTKQQEVIHDVLKTFSAWKDSELESATHREKPWIEARAGIPAAQRCDNVISKITMRDFYKQEIAPK